MADDSLEVYEDLDFHSCNVPYGTLPFEFSDLTCDQKLKLNQLKVDTIRSDEIYLAKHPQVRAIINIILRRVFRVRPKKDIRVFIARYFLRPYEDIKREVSEVIRSRKEHIHEGDSATRVPKPKRPQPQEEPAPEIQTEQAEEPESEEPEDVIRGIINEMLLNLETVCEKDVTILFSDHADVSISAYNYRDREKYTFPANLEVPVPVGKSISEELTRLEYDEKGAQYETKEGVSDKDIEAMVTTYEDTVQRYIEDEEYTGEQDEGGRFEGYMHMGEEEFPDVGTESYDAALWERQPDVFDESSIEEEDMEGELEEGKEITEIDYDEAEEPTPTTEVEGAEEEGTTKILGEREEPPTEAEELEPAAAPLESDNPEERMEEYFLAPIEDTVPTYLQTDDEKQDGWSTLPEHPTRSTAQSKTLPTKGRSEMTGLRAFSSTAPGGKRESRVQITIADKSLQEPKKTASVISGSSARAVSRSKITRENKSATSIRKTSN